MSARCFVAPGAWTGSEVTLTRDEAHHLVDVLRVGAGETVGVFDGRGREASARVEVGPDRRAVLSILSETAVSPPGVGKVLIQALPKGRRMDLVVEKATELGVSSIWPAVTERVVVRLGDGKRRERTDRWQRIALNAARQCGRAWVPDVAPVSDYAEVLDRCSRLVVLLIGSLQPEAMPLRAALQAARARMGSAGTSIGLLIGPEGDFTPDELRAALAAGAVPVGFGGRILRTETAALYGLSIIAYEF